MKAVLISIQPKWVEKIANGQKTIEVRKTAPKCEVPFKCYIYCTSPKKPAYTLWLNRRTKNKFLADGKVIGEFVCDKVYEIVNGKSSFFCNGATRSETNLVATQSCLDFCDMAAYLGDKNGYGWHISDLKIYEKPRELSEFNRPCSYKGICYSCKRFRPNGMPLDMAYGFCEKRITRPPQSWCYVEEVEK